MNQRNQKKNLVSNSPVSKNGQISDQKDVVSNQMDCDNEDLVEDMEAQVDLFDGEEDTPANRLKCIGKHFCIKSDKFGFIERNKGT